jgi:hypothetical protein
MVIGRVDLMDVISLEEYHDTIPKVLQENTQAGY